MNRKVEIMFDKENRQREAKRRLKEKQVALLNGSKKMVVVGATTLVLAGAFSCSQASAYDRYDDNSYRGLGYMCFSDEVGSDGDGSYVSPGTGDYGGISYGLYQFSTTTGSAKDFVNWSKDNNYPEIYKIFQDAGNPKAGTPAFGRAWKKCYKELEGKFEEAQTEFAMGELINPGYEKVKKETGIDLKKSRARTEFLISTANQFGRGGIVTLFKEVQNKGIKLSDDMSDTELLGIMCQHKYDTVDYHFRSSSSAVQRSARLRFKREKKELLKIAKEEEGPKLDEIDTNKEQTEATKTETSSSKTSKKEVVNDAADKYQGKGITYDFGEKNYKSGSLDCSGLISQMMNDMGVKVDAGNTNALKFSNDSKKISKDEVQPGDLVFWNDDNGSRHNSVYHIGMYVGNDTIVDCSPSHNGVGTRKLSKCKDTGDMHYTYGRYTKLEDKMKDYAQKIVESIDEFDDVITVDDSDIEKDYKKVEEKTTELKEAINENAKEEGKVDNKENTTDNKEDSNVQEENKDNETSLDKSEDASNKDEFESIIDEDKTDKSEDVEKDKADEVKDVEKDNANESKDTEEDKSEESSEDKEETNDSTLDKTLVVGDSHAKALEDKLKDNKDTEVEATVGASAYVYLNDTNYFGDKLIDKLPKDSDKINKVIISLGVNNIEGNSNINDVKKVIDKIESMYPGKDIYFMKVNHVGNKYKDGDVDKTNKMIDDLNKEIENYVKDKDKVKVIDASKGLETEGKLTETSDGLHVKDNDKLIDNLEKGIEENKDNETSLDKSEDASNKDEFESIIDEDKTDKSEEETNQKEETSKEEEPAVEKEETSEEENNQKEESEETSKEDKSEEDSSKEEDKSNENNQKEESSKEDNNQKEETTESSKEEEPVVEKEETSKEDDNVQEENNKKEETTESSKEEEPVVEKEESSKEDKSEKSSKEYNNVQESTKETSKEDKEENAVKEQKETSKEEDKSEVKQTVQDKSNESSKEEKPVVEEQQSVNDNQESATETSKEDNSESQKENSRVDELHSRLQNNLFGRILMS